MSMFEVVRVAAFELVGSSWRTPELPKEHYCNTLLTALTEEL